MSRGFSGHWAAQQLAEFLGSVSLAADEDDAAREGVERAAEALDAEVVALVRGGAVTAAIGWRRIEVPERELVEIASAGAGTVLVPGSGRCPAHVARLDEDDAHLILARAGAQELGPDEQALLRGMARGLSLTMRLLRTIAAERGLRARSDSQAHENARLLESLRKRQRVLEAMASIQRAISRRRPLSEVLDVVVTAACDLLGGAVSALLLVDEEDPALLDVAAQQGFDRGDLRLRPRRMVGEGVGGRAVAEGRLIVCDTYSASPDALPEFVEGGLHAAMATPVHEDGVVIGALLVASFAPGRTFTRTEQELLGSFAEHASLALTDARRAEAMAHQALHDQLTGLPNRALFTDRLQHALTQGRRRGTTCAVVVLDLDRFGTVNDSLGHEAGDDLLISVARRLDGCLRSADTPARLGGDEFAVLLEDLVDIEEAVLVAARIKEALRAPVVLQDREVFVGASVGIAAGTSGAADLLRQADVAMSRAKDERKGQTVLFEASMDSEAVERLELEGDLQRAIERDELVVHYQPVVALDGGTLAGFEALVRWCHPTRGLIAPPDFIPLAEETGLIVDLGRHVLHTACRQAARWDADVPCDQVRLMSVNLSGRQLEDPGIVDDVAAALAESGLPPESLVLEITETVLMRDIEATITRLEKLKELGVRLAIDDFGTGYSSLRYLQRFPIDVLKMAKPFVDGLQVDAEGEALARTIVDLAASLSLRCVAEGIEQRHQADLLRELGCGLGQGFHFARPMPAEELTALISDPFAVRAFAMPPSVRNL